MIDTMQERITALEAENAELRAGLQRKTELLKMADALIESLEAQIARLRPYSEMLWDDEAPTPLPTEDQ